MMPLLFVPWLWLFALSVILVLSLSALCDACNFLAYSLTTLGRVCGNGIKPLANYTRLVFYTNIQTTHKSLYSAAAFKKSKITSGLTVLKRSCKDGTW